MKKKKPMPMPGFVTGMTLAEYMRISTEPNLDISIEQEQQQVCTPSFGMPPLVEQEDQNSPKNKRKEHTKLKLAVSFLPRIPQPVINKRSKMRVLGTDRQSSFIKNQNKRPIKRATNMVRNSRCHTECQLFISGKGHHQK